MNVEYFYHELEDVGEQWSFWITSNNPKLSNIFTPVSSSYDVLCELAVYSYNLSLVCRKIELIDKLHYFYMWWHKNKRYMIKYRTFKSIAKLTGQDHSNVIHYTGKNGNDGKRKKSLNFEKNTACIKDFLES